MRALLAASLALTSFGFVFINSRLDATRRIFTLGSTYQFRILFGVRFIWPHFGLLYVFIKIVIWILNNWNKLSVVQIFCYTKLVYVEYKSESSRSSVCVGRPYIPGIEFHITLVASAGILDLYTLQSDISKFIHSLDLKRYQVWARCS